MSLTRTVGRPSHTSSHCQYLSLRTLSRLRIRSTVVEGVVRVIGCTQDHFEHGKFPETSSRRRGTRSFRRSISYRLPTMARHDAGASQGPSRADYATRYRP